MKFLFTDDKTGKWSDTTLRTWILFFLFLAVTIAIGVGAVLIITGMVKTLDIPPGVISFFYGLGGFSLGGQAFYLAKRINEARFDEKIFNSLPQPKTGKGTAD